MDRRHAAAIAALLAAATQAAAAEDVLAGRSLAATCFNCHGPDGHSRGEVPSLAGVPAADIVQAVSEFRSGQRSATVMHQLSKGYTDEQLRLIAAFFAAQPKR